MKWEATGVFVTIYSPPIAMVGCTLMHKISQLHNSAATFITILWLHAGTIAVMQTGSNILQKPIVLIAAGVSSVAICVVTVVAGLVCVKVRQTKKTETRYKLKLQPQLSSNSKYFVSVFK